RSAGLDPQGDRASGTGASGAALGRTGPQYQCAPALPNRSGRIDLAGGLREPARCRARHHAALHDGPGARRKTIPPAVFLAPPPLEAPALETETTTKSAGRSP